MIAYKNLDNSDKIKLMDFIDILNNQYNLNYSITDRWLDYIIANHAESVILGYYNDQIIAMATCMINASDATHATINIVVHEQHVKKGIGKKLFYKVCTYAKVKGIKSYEMYVKKRLAESVRFALNRGLDKVMYSWELKLELSQITASEERNDVSLRKARVEDGKVYAKIINEVFSDSIRDDAISLALSDPSVTIYLLSKNDSVVGSITVQARENISLGYIYDIAVLEQYRGKGLGSYAISNVLVKLRESGIEKVSLLVAGKNEQALKLYKKIGFTVKEIDIIMHGEI